MITLKSTNCEVKINEAGAEICSYKKGETEYIWPAVKEIWGSSAPVMFPICGGLKEDKYTLCGKEYTLNKHGFIKCKTFSVENSSDTSATLLYVSTPEDKVSYPFDFEFRATFELKGSTLSVTYKIANKSDSTMYFSVGSHEAYYTPEGIENYDIIFPEKVTLKSTTLCGNLLSDNLQPICFDTRVLPLFDKYFIVDALVFKDIPVHSATLRNRLTGRTVEVNFPNANYLLLWHKHGAGYICIEPWEGIPDTVGSSYSIEKKEGIRSLSKGNEYATTHTVTI